MRVAIVYGGYSSEKDASTENAKYIEKVLYKKGYETCMVPYQKDLISTLRTEQIDIVYVCVQGKKHGDGTIQAMLEHEEIPFTGSGAHAAALINDKIVSKLLFEKMGILTPRWITLWEKDYRNGLFDGTTFGYPFVAKAPSEGGSFGVTLIQNEEELEKLEEIFQYESPILIEEFIPGDFYTIGVLEQNGKVNFLPCVKGIEIQNGTENDNPDSLKMFTGEYTVASANMSETILKSMTSMSEKVFEGMGAKGIARFDFMVSKKDNRPYMLEINAVPGLKPKSLLPSAARIAGVSYEELIEGVLLEAWSQWSKGRNK